MTMLFSKYSWSLRMTVSDFKLAKFYLKYTGQDNTDNEWMLYFIEIGLFHLHLDTMFTLSLTF